MYENWVIYFSVFFGVVQRYFNLNYLAFYDYVDSLLN